MVAWNIADVPEVVGLLRRAPREDLVVLVATVLITLFVDLSYAIGLGVVLSAVLLLRRLVQLPAAQELLPDASGRIQHVSHELSEQMKSRPDIAFFTAQGMLSFHSAAAFEYQLNGDARQPLILRMKDVQHIDTSGLLTLEGIIEHRQRHGGRIILTAIQPSICPALERFGLIRAAWRGECVRAHTLRDRVDRRARGETRTSAGRRRRGAAHGVSGTGRRGEGARERGGEGADGGEGATVINRES